MYVCLKSLRILSFFRAFFEIEMNRFHIRVHVEPISMLCRLGYLSSQYYFESLLEERFSKVHLKKICF